VNAVDTDAIVRARRRRLAVDVLEAERDRETVLLDQIGEVLTELEGPRIDAAVFEQMEADDVALVREALDPEQTIPEEEWLEPEEESPAETARLRREEQETELLRLRQVIADCQRLQSALARYLEALGE
jgi:hypothetical protein